MIYMNENNFVAFSHSGGKNYTHIHTKWLSLFERNWYNIKKEKKGGVLTDGCREESPLSISKGPAVKLKIPIWKEELLRSPKQWLIFAQSHKRWKVVVRCTNHCKWFVIFPKLCSIHLEPVPAFLFILASGFGHFICHFCYKLICICKQQKQEGMSTNSSNEPNLLNRL